ncbi:MAG TPA: 23S rRNA (uracil(1939)-C(5))-methyltransferase RlmD [Elusimicrobiales bacterium]|nr:23S rRNA (uracil(1939)-C(5))-methyltransferase RlmD [Elusimicrobiales bacterium]
MTQNTKTTKSKNIFCRHFNECGGCSLQEMNYASQLLHKKQKAQELFKPLWDKEINITPSCNKIYYRNKMEFSFVRQIDKTKTKPDTIRFFEDKLGQKEKGRWDRAFELTDCYLLSDESVKLIAEVRTWANKSKIPFYDQRKHTGILRHLVVREAKNTQDKMVLLIVSKIDFDKNDFLNAVNKNYSATTIIIAQNEKVSDVASFEKPEILKGEGFIKEKIILPKFEFKGKKYADCDIVFRISPSSFFQTNTITAQEIYNKVRVLSAKINPSVIYDLYGGSGAFSFLCCDTTPKSICVEEVDGSIKDGIYNAKANGISNVEFVNAKTEDFLKENNLPENALVILDPPRCGLHPKALERLTVSGVKNIVYVSCNPKTLFCNLQQLSQSYKINSVEAFDLFPHTEHLEMLTYLSLKT